MQMDPLPRRRILDYVRGNPGATFREVLRNTGLSDGAGRHHVNVLVREARVLERTHRSTLRYFENAAPFRDHWRAVVLLREPELMAMHGWIATNPGCTQKDILAWAAEVPGWSRSTTQHRLKRLVDEGLLTLKPHGRFKRYSSAPMAGDVPAPLLCPEGGAQAQPGTRAPAPG